MSRQSDDELAVDGTIRNGYDYRLQTWVFNGIVQDVGNCPQHVGKLVKDIPGHEVRGNYVSRNRT